MSIEDLKKEIENLKNIIKELRVDTFSEFCNIQTSFEEISGNYDRRAGPYSINFDETLENKEKKRIEMEKFRIDAEKKMKADAEKKRIAAEKRKNAIKV